MAERRWPVARVDTVAGLAGLLDLSPRHLGWYADIMGMQRRTRTQALPALPVPVADPPGPHTAAAGVSDTSTAPRTTDVARSNRSTHTDAQRRARLRPGRSARTGASLHVRAEVVIGLDLTGFFAAVSAARIYGILQVAGYPETVVYMMTGLCPTATPIAVLGEMSPGGSADDRYALRRTLATPHLPRALRRHRSWRTCRRTGWIAGSPAWPPRWVPPIRGTPTT
ncbi:MAG: hypothetical protein H0V64_08375 [Geodermatophilaceae bacterium]|nr:hypothetical protein [Geodermatophilaceae bacterium]MDQ3466288.1 hypothetical protein [Actinomycetota bacterium]